MERILTCDGIAPFGHCGIIAVAVKHTEVGPNRHDFNGMVYITFATQDLACLFQSYWRSRNMYTSKHILDVNGNVTRVGNFRVVQSGSGSVVGQQRYSNKGPRCRTWVRWGPEVWCLWAPCHNQRVTRADVGLPPLPTHFRYGERDLTITTRDF